MIDKDPVVSVIIPYSPNHTPEDMLKEAVLSAINQDVPINIHIIEDDRQKGPAWARNRGLVIADTKYVAFLDADDLWNDQKLSRQIERLKDTGAAICVESDHTSTEEFITDLFLQQVYSVTSSILVDSEKVNLKFETDLERWEDHLFILEAASQGGACFCQDLVKIRKHSDGLSSRNTSSLILVQRKKFHSYVAQRVNKELVKKHSDTVYHHIYYNLGMKERWDGNFSSASHYFAHSLSYEFSLWAMFLLMFLSIAERLPPQIRPIFTIPVQQGLETLYNEGFESFVSKSLSYMSSD